MMEAGHEEWGAHGPYETGGGPPNIRTLFRMIDDLAAQPWTEADSERLLEQVMARIERRRRRRTARRIAVLGAALALAGWISFRVLGSGAFAGPRF